MDATFADFQTDRDETSFVECWRGHGARRRRMERYPRGTVADIRKLFWDP